MNAHEISLPWFTSFAWTLMIFIGGLVTFRVLFLHVAPLTSIGWKRVDYIWLSMALLGLLGAVGAGREVVAKNVLNLEKFRLESTRRYAEGRADFGTSIAVCRQFVRSEFSPPVELFDALQREFDSQCAWFKKASKALMEKAREEPAPIDFSATFGVAPAGGDRQIYESFQNSINGYNAAVKDVQTLQQQAKPTELELMVRLLGPLLVALALALRITKVSAEIRSELSKVKT